jgi:16S rRNA (guanine966-N2)-methyltransferase
MLESRDALAGARVIDLYAGTGALGLEALSRGATFATFVESDRRAIEALSRNVDAIRERGRSRILPYPVARAISVLAGDAATLVFCDPPYAHVEGAAKLLADAATNGAALDDAWIVLEHASRDTAVVAGASHAGAPLSLAEQREYGDTTLSFFRVYTRPRR